MIKSLLILIISFSVFSFVSAQNNPVSQQNQNQNQQELAEQNGGQLPEQGQQKIIYTPRQQQLLITAQNVRILPEADPEKGGYHIYIKKLPNVESVLLTETTKDPAGKNDSYAYRAKEYNPVNGDEVRYLNGVELNSQYSKYSLVDSTPEETEFFGQAFHIYVPGTIVYGYPWSRNGEVEIGKGTFINIRSFSKPYADYTGDYVDNPFMFDLVTKRRPKPVKVVQPEPEPEPEEVVLTDDYNPVASEKFQEIAEDMIYSKGPETIVEDIVGIIKDFDTSKPLDLVMAIDATGSMKNDIDELKKNLEPELRKILGENPTAQLGLLFYRDYGDTYKFMNLPVRLFAFTQNYATFSGNLNAIKIRGIEGGDVPEAVYEAMYASCEYFKWREDSERQIILIGDAEPHPTPRGSGRYSKEFVCNYAESKGIKIHAILLPHD